MLKFWVASLLSTPQPWTPSKEIVILKPHRFKPNFWGPVACNLPSVPCRCGSPKTPDSSSMGPRHNFNFPGFKHVQTLSAVPGSAVDGKGKGQSPPEVLGGGGRGKRQLLLLVSIPDRFNFHETNNSAEWPWPKQADEKPHGHDDTANTMSVQKQHKLIDTDPSTVHTQIVQQRHFASSASLTN